MCVLRYFADITVHKVTEERRRKLFIPTIRIKLTRFLSALKTVSTASVVSKCSDLI